MLRFQPSRFAPGLLRTDLPGGRVLICPGCGGRNDPNARICEWCGRPFVDERRRFPVAWIVGTAFMVFVAIAIVILLLALITALRSRTEGGTVVETPSFTTTEMETEPTDEPLAAIEPTLPPTPDPTALPTPAQSTPQVEFVQVGNTGGTGAFIRREARTGAAGIVAHRDGTPLRVIGTDEVVSGRIWRNVEDRAGNRGWMPRDYLVPTTQRF
jgi:hypothetical protein